MSRDVSLFSELVNPTWLAVSKLSWIKRKGWGNGFFSNIIGFRVVIHVIYFLFCALCRKVCKFYMLKRSVPSPKTTPTFLAATSLAKIAKVVGLSKANVDLKKLLVRIWSWFRWVKGPEVFKGHVFVLLESCFTGWPGYGFRSQRVICYGKWMKEFVEWKNCSFRLTKTTRYCKLPGLIISRGPSSIWIHKVWQPGGKHIFCFQNFPWILGAFGNLKVSKLGISNDWMDIYMVWSFFFLTGMTPKTAKDILVWLSSENPWWVFRRLAFYFKQIPQRCHLRLERLNCKVGCQIFPLVFSHLDIFFKNGLCVHCGAKGRLYIFLQAEHSWPFVFFLFASSWCLTILRIPL